MCSVLLKNKKGDTWTLKEFVILFFAAIIIISITGFFYKLYAVTLSQKDDGSIANFEDRLYANTKQLMESPEATDYIIANYFLGKDRIVVGFDTRWDDTVKVDSTGFDSNIYKPFKCGNAACLCLYTNEWDRGDSANRDQSILSCRSEAFAGHNVVFLSTANRLSGKTRGIQREDGSGDYLIFYGEDWEVQRIYIEKKYEENENKYYIYISTINENGDNDVNLRKRQIDDSRES